MGLKEYNQTVQETLARVRDRHKERGKLFDELEESLALTTLWPEVFDHGQISTRIDGVLSSPSKAKIIITNGVGEVRKIFLKDAPRVLRKRLIKTFAPKDAYGFRSFFKRLNKEEDRGKKT